MEAYEPLCQVEYCPRPSDPDYHRCAICGREGVEHDHVEPRSLHPERALDVTNIVVLCPRHHRLKEEGIIGHKLIERPDGTWFYYAWDVATGETISERSLPGPGRPPVLSEGLPVELVRDCIARIDEALDAVMGLSDDGLLEWVRVAHEMGTRGYVALCLAIYAYRQRYRGEGWDESGAHIFGYRPSTLRLHAHFAEHLLAYLGEADPLKRELVASLPDRLLRLVARCQDIPRALDAAIAYYAETQNAEPTSLAVRLRDAGLLGAAHRLYRCRACSLDVEPQRIYVCPRCGAAGELSSAFERLPS